MNFTSTNKRINKKLKVMKPRSLMKKLHDHYKKTNFKDMKKLLSLIAIAAFGLSTAFAQTPATTTPAKAKTVVKKEVKTTTAPAKADAKKVETKTTTATTKVKADGTPDKRFKENKTKAVTKVETKKDGTPDMRYKANKTAAKKN